VLAASLSASLLMGFVVEMRAQTQKLASRYKKWLDEEVVYILSKDERELFLKLSTDQERDTFIERFWEIRNPNPGAPTNSFREEHYRRIEYANLYFSQQAATDGWRTDRGRVYILMGPPKQKDVHVGHTDLKPFEIWFYSSDTPALPPFFYVLFYQKDNIGDYRLYSPYFDGPEKLVRAQAENNRTAALKIVDKAAGREVARTTLSLLPDEPVDWSSATSSLQSDVMLSALKNLANHPHYRAQIDQRRALLESVTYRLIVAGDALREYHAPLYGPDGNVNLHFMLQLPRADSFAVGERQGGGYYYSLNVTTRVFGPANQLLYTQERAYSRNISEAQLEEIKPKVLAYEGLLPLAPGKYRIEFLLTNLLRKTAFRVERNVEIPAQTGALAVGELIPFSSAETIDPSQSGWIPFSAGGVKFTPELASELTVVPGRELRFFYQIRSAWTGIATGSREKMTADYNYGRPAARGDAKRITDELDPQQFDPNGLLVNGKAIPTADIPAGNYMLTLTVSDASKSRRAFSNLNFRVSTEGAGPATWRVYDEGVIREAREGLTGYHRGMCILAQGNKAGAVQWLRAALQRNPDLAVARYQLVDIYFGDQHFSQVTELFPDFQFSSATPENAILRVAESFERTGNKTKATEALEAGFRARPASSTICQALADSYRKLGNNSKAAEYDRKAKELATAASNSSASSN
jgi:GWxTD domain-containing protein